MFKNFTRVPDAISISTLDSVFKYMSSENGLQILEDGLMVFNSPLDFNDPYDCSPSLVDVSNELIIKIFNVSQKNIFLGSDFIDSSDGLKIINLLKELPMKNAIENVLRYLKISCFSKKKHNLLMWSHYSRNHTGICIEFDVSELISYSTMNGNTPFFLDVKYSFQRDSFSWNEIGHVTQLIEWLRTKSIDWAYEKEVRMIKVTTEDFSLPITKGMIKHIYLGSRINPDNEKRIIEICKNKFSNVMISKTSLSKKEYVLEETLIFKNS